MAMPDSSSSVGGGDIPWQEHRGDGVVIMRSDLESELKPTLIPAASGLKNVSK